MVSVRSLEGGAQVDNVRVVAKGITEFLDRLIRAEGSCCFDGLCFDSELFALGEEKRSLCLRACVGYWYCISPSLSRY